MSNWGDPAELAELVGQLLDQHGAALALYAAQWSPTPDDCVQEALIELARTRPLPDQPVAWVYRVVKCRALNSARAQRRRAEREHAAWTSRLTSLKARTEEERAELLDALNQLPAEAREIVVLKVWGNLTFAEIATVVECGPSTIHRQYQTALETFRKKWGVSCPVTTKTDRTRPTSRSSPSCRALSPRHLPSIAIDGCSTRVGRRRWRRSIKLQRGTQVSRSTHGRRRRRSRRRRV